MERTVYCRLDVPATEHRALKVEAARRGLTLKGLMLELLRREVGTAKPAAEKETRAAK